MTQPAWKRWLKKRTANPRHNLLLLGIGFAVFFVGMAMLVVAENLLKSSLSQELIAIGGLILSGVGSILAATGYLSLSVFRLLNFLSDDNDRNPPSRH